MAELASVAVPTSAHPLRIATLWGRLPVLVRYAIAGGTTQVIYLSVLGLALLAKAPYMAALVLAQLAAMSFAFPTYRGLVFAVDGSWRRQAVAFLSIWWTGAALSLTGVPLLVEALGLSPFPAQLLVLCLVVTLSFIGHRNVTFRRKHA